MTDPTLQMYLPAFMVIATWLIVFWKQFRKISRIPEPEPTTQKIIEYNRLKRISLIFWIIFSLFGVMTIIYSLVPEFYYVFLPLDIFHHPLINVIGLLIMKIAIVLIVVAQVHIDKEIYKYSRNIESLSAMELVRYSEKMLLTGMLVLFIGFFTTITNIIGLLLVVTGVIIYLKLFFFNPPHQLQN
jgi:vacuolar-type H+-ATPase subunit I/STV1